MSKLYNVLGAGLVGLLFACANSKTPEIKEQELTNPHYDTSGNLVSFGDPFILHASDGKYYCYGTTEESGSNDFRCYSSDDMNKWNYEGVVFTPKAEDWTTDCFWAPEVYEINGKFYMLHSSNWKENPNNDLETFRIGVAVSDSPTGPFAELSDKPIFDPGYPIIDGNLLIEDGHIYLYYSRCCYKHAVESELASKLKEEGQYDEIEESWIYGVEIKPDFSGTIGEPVALLFPPYKLYDPQNWENRAAEHHEANRRWNEGSYIFKHGDTYYMMYSANYYAGPYYAVGYATSKNPLGPFQKAEENPILERNNDKGGEVYCTGHNMVLQEPDGSLYCVYHARTEKTDSITNKKRMVFIDKMEITENGKLRVLGPTSKMN